nr:hypothetical protein [Shigella sp. FC1882]
MILKPSEKSPLSAMIVREPVGRDCRHRARGNFPAVADLLGKLGPRALGGGETA